MSIFKPKTVEAAHDDSSSGQVLISIAEKYIGMHENDGTNRAPWLDAIEKKAGLIAQPWCAIIAFYEWIPLAEKELGKKSLLIPCAHVRTAASYNKNKLHRDPRPGDIGFLGHVGSSSGHLILVRSSAGDVYETIEGNTSSQDGSNTNGGEVASHVRHNRTEGGLEVIGFASPFV